MSEQEPRVSDMDRFMSKVLVDKESGCWLWQGGKTDKTSKGYGQFWFRSRHSLAHRVSMVLFLGIEPNVVDHFVCDNPPCVNPDHLRDTDRRSNTLRGKGPSAINARKTHCVRGHELSGANLKRCRRGHRRCRECDDTAERRRR